MMYQATNIKYRDSEARCHQEDPEQEYVCLEFYDGGNSQVIHLTVEGARTMRNQLTAALSIRERDQTRQTRTMLTRRNLEIGK